MKLSGWYVVEVPEKGNVVGEMHIFRDEEEAVWKQEELRREGRSAELWEM